MTDNTITITLDDILGPGGLEGAWEGMTEKLAKTAEGKFYHAENAKSFHGACVEAINDAVARKISEKIELLMAEPIQKTDRYGSPIGEPKSFNEMIGEAVEQSMETTVDLYGKPKPGKPSCMHDLTLFEYALQRVALKEVSEAVIKEAKKVNAEAKKAVSNEIAKAIAKTIK